MLSAPAPSVDDPARAGAAAMRIAAPSTRPDAAANRRSNSGRVAAPRWLLLMPDSLRRRRGVGHAAAGAAARAVGAGGRNGGVGIAVRPDGAAVGHLGAAAVE